MKYYHDKKQHISVSVALALAVLAVIGIFTYEYQVAKDVGAQDSMLQSDGGSTNSPLTPDQLALLSKIEGLKLDGSVFKDPVFLALEDKSVELIPEDAGRINPFAPLGGTQTGGTQTQPAPTRPTTPRR